MSEPLWLELEGADNVRDVGGLPTGDGARVRPGRLLRSDNLQALTDRDVRLLVDELGLREVIDLRTGLEVRGEGPGPMLREERVRVQHLSLFPEDGAPSDPDLPTIMPWQDAAKNTEDELERRYGASGHYLRYLLARPDSIMTALRTIAHGEGATLVHCAAGKDRTGVVVAMALEEVGVEREAIATDYALSAGRVERIYARIGQRPTYASEIAEKGDDVVRHKPRASTMRGFFTAAQAEVGGLRRWLREQGWSERDAAALRATLLD